MIPLAIRRAQRHLPSDQPPRRATGPVELGNNCSPKASTPCHPYQESTSSTLEVKWPYRWSTSRASTKVSEATSLSRRCTHASASAWAGRKKPSNRMSSVPSAVGAQDKCVDAGQGPLRGRGPRRGSSAARGWPRRLGRRSDEIHWCLSPTTATAVRKQPRWPAERAHHLR